MRYYYDINNKWAFDIFALQIDLFIHVVRFDASTLLKHLIKKCGRMFNKK